MPSFDDTVTKTIEEIIRNVFEDDDTAEAIFQYLKKDNSQMLDDWVKVFANALPKILGEGHVIIEDLILETLYSKYEQDLVFKKDYKFPDYIIELQKHMREN